MDDTIIGTEANLAARLRSIAEGGKIVIPNETFPPVQRYLPETPSRRATTPAQSMIDFGWMTGGEGVAMSDDLKGMEMAIARASMWFQLHADQRMKLFNFYVLLFLGLLAGFGAAVKEKVPALELGIPMLLLLITYSFKHLDRRSASLVKHAEHALDVLEAKLADVSGLAEIRLIQKANKKDDILSYRQAFNLVFFAGALASAAGVVLAILRLCESQIPSP